jgi:hypothetical protein
LVPGGRGTVTLAGERGGGRVPIPTRGHIHIVVILICLYFVVEELQFSVCKGMLLCLCLCMGTLSRRILR